LRRAIEIDPNFVERHDNLGNYLKDRGKIEEAIASYDRAIKIDPSFVTARANAGNCYNYLGEQEKAIACYEKAIEIGPNFIKPHLMLGKPIKYKAGDPRIGKLESFLKDYDGAEKTHVQLYFGLAKAYEEIGDVDTRFEYLLAGNGLRKEQREYTT